MTETAEPSTFSPLRVAVRIGFVLVAAPLLLGLYSDHRELDSLEAESERLSGIVGRLELRDPSRIGVVNIRNDGPNDWQWRVRVPAGPRWRIANRKGSGGSGWSSFGSTTEPLDLLIRCRIVEQEEGSLLFILHGSGSSTHPLSPDLATFIRTHWDRLDVDVAAETPLKAGPDAIVPLIRITVPVDVLDEFSSELRGYVAKELESSPLLVLEVGSETAFEAREQEIERRAQEVE